MNGVWILGAGGLAKEICWLVRSTGLFTVRGFIDKVGSAPIVVSGQEFPVIPEGNLPELPIDDMLALGVGDPGLRLQLGTRYRGKRRFPNIIHPSVLGDMDGLSMGEGNLLAAQVTFTTNIRIGDHNLFNLGCTIGHDCIVGSGNVINPGSNISGNVVMGDRILIGTNATLLQGVTVGDGAVVGAASLVNKAVAAGVTVVGVPAKPLLQ